MREFVKSNTPKLMYMVDDVLKIVYCKFRNEASWRVSAFHYEDLGKDGFIEINTSLENE